MPKTLNVNYTKSLSVDFSKPHFFDHALYENFTVMYVLPLSNHDNGSLMAIASFYAMLFMLGTCGNAAILAVVHHVRASDSRSRHNTTLTYICILCIVDFLSMLPLPMTIIDQILGFWMFGTFACKLFRLLEHIGKIFSTFILVAFSLDRYCAVCHPLQVRVRNHQTVYMLLSTMFLFTCVLLFPILLYAHSKELIIHEKFDLMHKTITKMHLYKCVDDLGDNLFIGFTLYCFILAYLMPLLFMIYFYYGMLVRLFKQARAVRQTLRGRRKGMEGKIPIGHIAVYTLAICLFHFLCWTPYWISVLYSLYVEIFNPSSMLETPSFKFIYFMYGIHALPYINSASNFILYGLLNRQLHQSPNRKYERNGGTHSAPIHRLTDCSEMINQTSACIRESFTTRSLGSASTCTQGLIQQRAQVVRSNTAKNEASCADGPAYELSDLRESVSVDEDSIVI